MKISLRGKSTTAHIVIVVMNWKLLRIVSSTVNIQTMFGYVLPIHLNSVVY